MWVESCLAETRTRSGGRSDTLVGCNRGSWRVRDASLARLADVLNNDRVCLEAAQECIQWAQLHDFDDVPAFVTGRDGATEG